MAYLNLDSFKSFMLTNGASLFLSRRSAYN